MADILGMIAQGGSGMGSGLLGNFLQAKQTTATQRLMGPAMAGDPNAMQELMGVNPEMGMQVQDRVAQKQAALAQRVMAQQEALRKQEELAIKQQEAVIKQQEADTKRMQAKTAKERLQVDIEQGNTKVVDGQIMQKDPNTGEWVAKAGTSGDIKKIREETRGFVRKGLDKVTQAADIITSNRDKLEGLASEIRSGNRTAVAQGIVALVKLNDPTSAVLEGEMRSALNTQNPVAAVTALLTEKGADPQVINSVLNSIDPLRPEAVDIDQLLNTADAMISANVPSILQNYEGLVEQSQNNLTDAGYQSIFTSKIQDKLSGLQKYVQAPAAVVEEAPEPEIVVTPENIGTLTPEQKAARLQQLKLKQQQGG